MNEQATRLFSLDPGMDASSIHLKTFEHAAENTITLPLAEKDCYISPLASPLTLLPSIDTRLQGLLRPLVSDRSVLKPKNFYSLATETCHTLREEAKRAQTPEAHGAVNDLLSLLEENIALMSLFTNYMNLVRKI